MTLLNVSLLIYHQYEELHVNICCLSNRTGKWTWLCARYSYITWCLTHSSGCWGFVWQTRAFLVVIVVMTSLFSFTDTLFFSFSRKAIQSYFLLSKDLTGISIPSASQKCSVCLFEWWLWATKSQSEKLCFLILNISSDLCDTWPWDTYVNYSDIWFFFTAKSYFLWVK